MVTKFFPRANSLPLTIISSTHFSLFPNSSLSIISLTSTAATQAITPKSHLYGPSLLKGRIPFQNSQSQLDPKPIEEQVIDEEKFSRVFDIAALRVPAKNCFALESRLRGHLLNWPRIRNIARVPGDEVEEELVSLLDDSKNGNGDEEGKLDALNQMIYGRVERGGEELIPVLYREKLVKEFNYRGFVKFKNLAKISRPPKRKRKKEEGEEKMRGKCRKKGFSVVEVVEEEEEDWKGLLGDKFKGRKKWRGSTRLLLLDERYADKGVEDLPQAIQVANPNTFGSFYYAHSVLQVALQEAMEENPTSSFELIKCKLTLFYDYWQMNEVLEALLPEGVIIPSSFEIIGHIAHLNLRDEHLPYKNLIAKVVLDKNKPKIQTVVNKIDAIHNDYRTLPLEVLAGNHSLVTMVVESGLRFHVDLATVYWNSRLAK
ncbi:tRNA (guanine(37)-N1)-methyltransferase 1 isoform X1 [Jatropha curcas]|uniref:tRNA (guanine(37)-N1)-methyltransferase 1 isoform X1 n=1 Tax=Jatropha curcas TaxID=180498 RepID=UPI00189418E1|nr:tRNA (guanine(37)-N1)-methyltransferase 1 isoform X1 [Jatropha curcas]